MRLILLHLLNGALMLFEISYLGKALNLLRI